MLEPPVVLNLKDSGPVAKLKLPVVFEDKDDEPKFAIHPELEKNQTLMEAWAEVNEMLEDSFIENNDEWYLYVIAG